jgi:hypothetical protein
VETFEPYAQYSEVTATASDLLKSSKHIHPLMNLFLGIFRKIEENRQFSTAFY